MVAGGVTKTQKKWAEELGIGYSALRKRLRDGWTPEEVVAGRRAEKPRWGSKLTINGVEKLYAEWAEEAGVPVTTFRARIKKLGWTPEQAVKGTRS